MTAAQEFWKSHSCSGLADTEKWSRIWAKDLGIIPIKTFNSWDYMKHLDFSILILSYLGNMDNFIETHKNLSKCMIPQSI